MLWIVKIAFVATTDDKKRAAISAAENGAKV